MDDYRERGRDRDRDRNRDRNRDRDRDRDRIRDRDKRDRDYDRREHRDYERRDRDYGRRKRSPSRSPSPTPRKRRRERTSTGWDKAPSLTGASTAPLVGSGLMPTPGGVPLPLLPGGVPGAVRIGAPTPGAASDPNSVLASLNLSAIGGILNPSQARQAKRIYCGNIPPNFTDRKMAEFLHGAMVAAGLVSKESLAVGEQESIETGLFGCITAVQINNEKNFAFIEFRTPDDATGAVNLDGISLDGHSLKLRRPKDYVPLPEAPTSAPAEEKFIPGIVSTNVPDTENKIFVGGLPSYLNEEQVKELLSSYGPLKSFNLVKDPNTGLSKGFAFCEFMDPELTDVACEGLHGMQLQDKTLVVQRAHVGARPGVTTEAPGVASTPSLEDLQNPGVTTILNVQINAAAMLGALIAYSKKTAASEVIQVLNLFSREDLVVDDEYCDMIRDIEEEAGKYGKVVSLVVPRPRVSGGAIDVENDLPDSSTDPPGVGRAFIEYDCKQAAEKGLHSLGGRKYNGRTVITAYFDKDKFAEKKFND